MNIVFYYIRENGLNEKNLLNKLCYLMKYSNEWECLFHRCDVFYDWTTYVTEIFILNKTIRYEIDHYLIKIFIYDFHKQERTVKSESSHLYVSISMFKHFKMWWEVRKFFKKRRKQ